MNAKQRALKRARDHRYRHSAKGRARNARYEKSLKGWARTCHYAQNLKGVMRDWRREDRDRKEAIARLDGRIADLTNTRRRDLISHGVSVAFANRWIDDLMGPPVRL